MMGCFEMSSPDSHAFRLPEGLQLEAHSHLDVCEINIQDEHVARGVVNRLGDRLRSYTAMGYPAVDHAARRTEPSTLDPRTSCGPRVALSPAAGHTLWLSRP